MKTVLFLDFDGVLNHAQWLDDGGPYELYPPSVMVANKIVELLEADVVVSSSWRSGRSLEQLQDILDKHGFTHKIIGVTPLLGSMYRGEEISVWLKTNDRLQCPVLIIDDGTDMLPYMDCLLQTNFDTGLRHEHIDKALTIVERQKQMKERP